MNDLTEVFTRTSIEVHHMDGWGILFEQQEQEGIIMTSFDETDKKGQQIYLSSLILEQTIKTLQQIKKNMEEGN